MKLRAFFVGLAGWVGLVGWVALTGLSSGSAFAAGPGAGASISASEQSCRACHSLDSPKVGPPFRAISERYRGDSDAVAKLQKSILEGSSGKWNTGAQMPPNPITAEEAQRFASWVLGVR